MAWTRGLVVSVCFAVACGGGTASSATDTGTSGESTATPTVASTTAGGVPSDADTGTSSAASETTVAAPDSADATADATADASSGGESGEPAAKSLVIAIDGLRPDALAAAHTPNLDGLLLGGWREGYGSAYTPAATALTDADTYSGPNHWAIMTGATGSQHGVTGNADVGDGDAEGFPHYLSELEAADDGLNTAYLFTWVPDFAIPCEADYVTSGDDATNAARVRDILAGTFRAKGWGRGVDADAVFIFLDDVDGAGHGSGFDPNNSAYLAEIEQVDAQVGLMLEGIASRPTVEEEDWQIVVTSDHGGIGTNHGGESPEELAIPFGVTSRSVESGVLPSATEDATGNIDVVPTVLRHFGLRAAAELTGRARG